MADFMSEEKTSRVLQRLSELKIEATTYSHTEAFTVEEQAVHCAGFPGTLTKNLFLRDKKYGLFLVTCKATRDVNLKTVGTLLKLAGSNLRFGDEELLQEKLGVMKGSVSPFALINDTANEVTFCIDQALLNEPEGLVNMHPMRNDRTTSVTANALLAFLEGVQHVPKVLDFDSVPAEPAGAAGAKPAAGGAKGSGSSTTKDAEAPGVNRGVQKGETGLSLSVTKEGDFSRWYTEVITLSEMIDYSDISGCYILRPWSYFIWEQIQTWFDEKIKALGVKNTYFPLFVSKHALETEKDHVAGFAPEVAWVTKSGETDLQEHIAIRPTSETIMYPFFAKWIRSHRDLPLEINQWCNVVRWEFKDATPFLRSREFLWQEGHTAHVSYEEAQQRVLSILDLYRQVYEDLLAVPVIKGQKTESEKFAGGYHTTTVEAYINGSGRAIQGATSHNLGQNFGKMFKIYYEDDKGGRSIPWQTSWGLTTRTIGVSVMVHGDDKGLVLPPRVAPTQVIICPISGKTVEYAELVKYAEDLKSALVRVGVRADVDSRQNYTPGWKFNHWEQKGVPIRIEVGCRDFEARQYRLVRRDTGDKSDHAVATCEETIRTMLDTIHADMFKKAKAGRDEKLVQVTKWADFVPALNKHCLVLTPFCDEAEWEDKVKVRRRSVFTMDSQFSLSHTPAPAPPSAAAQKMSREEVLQGTLEADTTATSVAAKTLCKPFDQPPLPEGTPCFVSGKPATTWVLWGRSY